MEPKEYKEGFTEFLGCRVDLSKHPLVPRPETEYWVDKAIAVIGESECKVLDIFTGSGCVGIGVATKCPNTKVSLSDKINYISTPLPKNATFVESDIFSNIPGKFDFILANPPYVPLGKGVGGIMKHEPKIALYAGKEGMDVITPFLEEARRHLEPGGQIWMEFGSDQKEDVTNLLRDFNYYQSFNCTFHKDQHDRWRYLVAKF